MLSGARPMLTLLLLPGCVEPTEAPPWAVVRLDAGGLAATRQGETVSLSLREWGRAGQPQAPTPRGAARCDGGGQADGCMGRIEQDYVGMVAWAAPGPRSVRQGWDLHERPAGSGSIVLHLSVEGAEATRLGSRDVLLVGAHQRWRYTGLFAWDQDGRTLPAAMVPDDDGIRIEVDDEGARWPIFVDPDLTSGSVSVYASDGALGDDFGTAGLAARDLHGDGFDDLAVGATGRSGSSAAEGAVYLYSGGSGGLDLATEALFTATSPATDADFGAAVALLDADRDGDLELFVGAPGAASLGVDAGEVLAYVNDGTGPNAAIEFIFRASDGAEGDRFGQALAVADLDADGDDELLVAAPGRAGGGAAYVFWGLGGAAHSSVETVVVPSDLADDDGLGAVGAAGDTNGDGIGDLVAGASGHDHGATDAGGAWLFLGDGLGSELELSATAPGDDDQFGAQVTGAGDVDGDGYDDVLVGAPGRDLFGIDSGAVYLFPGGAGGPGAPLEFSAGGGAAGASVSGGGAAGDLNADGFADVVLSAPGADTAAGATTGALYVFLGSAAGLDLASELLIVADDAAAGERLGTAPATADFNGDGQRDLYAGAAEGAGLAAGAGRVVVFVGGCGDADGDGYCVDDGDCDDTNPRISPGAGDLACDGMDSDCDGADATTLIVYRDGDGDGYGDASIYLGRCVAPGPGWVTNTTDCNDYAPTAFPGSAEVDCDGVDNNCDGVVDENDTYVQAFQDNDGDGYGNPNVSRDQCNGPFEGWTLDNTDCDDRYDWVNPGILADLCDYWDNDCDGAVDEEGIHNNVFLDADGDGYGDPTVTETGRCSDDMDGWSLNSSDCNDSDGSIYPLSGYDNTCDGVDNDCSGTIDGDFLIRNECDVSINPVFGDCGGCAEPAPDTDGPCCAGAAFLVFGLGIRLRRRGAARRRAEAASR